MSEMFEFELFTRLSLWICFVFVFTITLQWLVTVDGGVIKKRTLKLNLCRCIVLINDVTLPNRLAET